MITDEQFFAWLDGELEPGEAAAIDALLAADPDLQRRADAHRALAGRLGAAFDPIAAAPVPDRLLEAARDADVIDLGAVREQRAARPAGMQWAAMAATLAIGIVAGSMINRGQSGPVRQEGGQLVASGSLAQALESRWRARPRTKARASRPDFP